MRTDYAQQYRELWRRHWWWRSRESWVLGWVDRLHRRGPLSRILDVGCGDGLFFEELSRFGKVEGLEPDASLLADPRWRSRIRNEPLGPDFRVDSPYDLLLMLDVLEHIADDAGALDAARSSLRPDGHLLLTVPALSWLWSRHDEANEHHRRYSARGLHETLAKAGFAVETVRYFFVWTVAPLLARRWLAPAGVVGAEYEVPIPPGPINGLLEGVSRLEHAVGRFVSWPVGSSLLAVARRA